MARVKNTSEWYKLDNASKIYPSTGNGRWNAVYRVCAVMKSRVERVVLQKALDVVIERFPSYNVVLRKGLFWYFFQGATLRPIVTRESDYPCKKFDIMNREPLFRVMYSDNRIIVEFSHCITDGFGAVNFLDTLVLKYLHLLGHNVDRGNLLHYKDNPKEEEFEDSYSRYYEPEGNKKPVKPYRAYHITGQKEVNGVLNVIHGEVATDKLKALAKTENVTVNEYILGALAYVIYKHRAYDKNGKNKKSPVSVQYSVNLRKMFPSWSLRMFSGFVDTKLNETSRSNMTFEEVLQAMTAESRKVGTKEYFQTFINCNYSLERNFVIRLAPLFLKNFVMKIAYYKQGGQTTSLIMSNMGKSGAPEAFAEFVDRYEFIIGPQKYNNPTVTISSFNNKTVFTFARTIKNPVIEREFFRFLQDKGLDVFVNANKGGKNEKSMS